MSEFQKRKQRVKALADQGKTDEALAECELLLTQLPESRADVLRLRAYVYAREGNYHDAMAAREAVIRGGNGTLRDYYQLGDNALSAGRYADASRWLQETLRLGSEQHETWFESAALLLLAYARMKMGQLQEAMDDIERAAAIDPESAMPIRGEGIVTHQSLRDEIMRRIDAAK